LEIDRGRRENAEDVVRMVFVGRFCETPNEKSASNTDALQLLHQEHGATALDFARDFAVHVRRHAGDPAGQNFPAFRDEFF
jgi:hypothetical protein